MERVLARIAVIDDLNSIEGADAIEVASIDGWKVVVKKNEFQIGDKCVYCEIDSILPEKEEFEFLRRVNFRIKTIRLRGQISQGIIFPTSILPVDYQNAEIGTDVTDIIGVTKYEKKVPAQLQGVALRYFPPFLRKTDEERVQNLSKCFDKFKGCLFYATIKYDGTSFTCYKHEENFGVCSRNMELKEDYENTYWQAAKKYNLAELLPDGYAIQGELIGPGIQSNSYGLSEIKVLVFNVWDIKKQTYLTLKEKKEFVKNLNMELVSIVEENLDVYSMSIDQILTMAEGKSDLNSKVEREGLVFRSQTDEFVSFKAISNKFLLNGGD